MFLKRPSLVRNSQAHSKMQSELEAIKRWTTNGTLSPAHDQWCMGDEEELFMVDKNGSPAFIAADVLRKLTDLPDIIKLQPRIRKLALNWNITDSDAEVVARFVASHELQHEVATFHLEFSPQARPCRGDGLWSANSDSLTVYKVVSFVLSKYFQGSKLVSTGYIGSATAGDLSQPLSDGTKYRNTNGFRESVGLGSKHLRLQGVESLDVGMINPLYNLVSLASNWQVNLTVDAQKSREVALAILCLSRLWIPLAANSHVMQGHLITPCSRLQSWTNAWEGYCQAWQGVPEAGVNGFVHQVETAIEEGYPMILPYDSVHNSNPWSFSEAYVGRMWRFLMRWRMRGDESSPALTVEIRPLDMPSCRNDGISLSALVITSMIGLMEDWKEIGQTNASTIATWESDIPKVCIEGMNAEIDFGGGRKSIRGHANTLIRLCEKGCKIINIEPYLLGQMIRKLKGAITGAEWQKELLLSMRTAIPDLSPLEHSQKMMLTISQMRSITERNGSFKSISDWPTDWGTIKEICNL